ncbi:DNA polymerase III subunit delta' [Martelella mediterranea]|uniref:DNA polymerase III delta prime subunit n=1 Tax=Martelella mediterranea TaxID=293089 RepID=A0A4R3NET3_9HYPH|nr:DNA polymerase III subunit delta' [Martelella mediterranea]TCT30240.1 DNA polymerase III delta prime subunit [Martelella mediterranea]
MSDQHLLDGAISPAANPALFGHDRVLQYLAETYRSGKMHHALLLEGAQGIGKATLAFRFANHILHAPHPPSAPDTIIPFDASAPLTRQIISGASHDLLHLQKPVDPKTGKMRTAITVAEVRRAGHFFSQTSGTGNWRVVIVDAADDLNRSAANAILKILEEPPKNAIFFLISHAPGRLLPTIRSRCMPLRLKPLETNDLTSALNALGVAMPAIEPDALQARSGGSVAQALKLINYGGGDVIDVYNEILSGEGARTRLSMHKLADTLAKRENETVFDFFLDHLDTDIKAKARDAALSGQLDEAEKLAALTTQISVEVGEARAFNLDSKQLLLNLLARVQQIAGSHSNSNHSTV